MYDDEYDDLPKHHIPEEVCEAVKDGLKKAKKISDEIFGDKSRSREVFAVYANLLDTLHCNHQEKKPWES